MSRTWRQSNAVNSKKIEREEQQREKKIKKQLKKQQRRQGSIDFKAYS